MTTAWLTEGTPEQIVLDALQRIAFEDVADPRELAQDALHGAGFASMKVEYRGGPFDLAWLRDGERVKSAGDGTGAAIIVGPDGERRLNVGDEVRL